MQFVTSVRRDSTLHLSQLRGGPGHQYKLEAWTKLRAERTLVSSFFLLLSFCWKTYVFGKALCDTAAKP